MAVEMTTRERFSRMFEHREADRVPFLDAPWATTIDRWRREGMPGDVGYVDHFGLDRVSRFSADNSPRYEQRTLEETEDYRVYTTQWGVTLKSWKHETSTPEYVDFTVTTPDKWREARKRMTPTRDRVDWDRLKREYPGCRKRGDWIEAGLWFGFDVTHSWMVGTERLLMALATDPEWAAEMFSHYLEVHLALWDLVLAEGYTFDAVHWPDDMGYKQNTFFSLNTYRELLLPVQKKAVDWAHGNNMKVRLHSCGYIKPFIPDLLEIGVDGLNPLEVKAGMDPLELKGDYGGRLVLHGGLSAVLWDDPAAVEAEMRRIIPVLKESGGYIFASDHSIPDAVSLSDFTRIVELYKELGRY